MKLEILNKGVENQFICMQFSLNEEIVNVLYLQSFI